MFAKFSSLFALTTLLAVVSASPVEVKKLVAAPVHPVPVVHDKVVVTPPIHEVNGFEPISFDKWGGFESLTGFDNFHGANNFDGFNFKQTFVKQEEQLVCRTQQVEIIQQRLLVLQELAKKVITETICEVEVQTIVFEQFHAGLGGFSRDLRRHEGAHQVGFDQQIVDHFPKFLDANGGLTFDNWGFTGLDLGKNSVVVGGHNWVDSTSFNTVKDAWLHTRTALGNLWFRS